MSSDFLRQVFNKYKEKQYDKIFGKNIKLIINSFNLDLNHCFDNIPELIPNNEKLYTFHQFKEMINNLILQHSVMSTYLELKTKLLKTFDVTTVDYIMHSTYGNISDETEIDPTMILNVIQKID
jgi:hypothetical protein